jgi:hypothetical protein
MSLGRRPKRTIATHTGSHYAPGVRAYALIELGDSEAIDLFLREEDAQAALEDALRDEPGWAGTLRVEAIDLDERDLSPN